MSTEIFLMPDQCTMYKRILQVVGTNTSPRNYPFQDRSTRGMHTIYANFDHIAT